MSIRCCPSLRLRISQKTTLRQIEIEVLLISMIGIWLSLWIKISVSLDVNRWTIVGVSFVRQVVVLVASDDFSKFNRVLFMISSNQLPIKWVFHCHCSVWSYSISFTCKRRLSLEVISVVKRQKESKCCKVLTLVKIFLYNNRNMLTSIWPSSKINVTGFICIFKMALTSVWFLIFQILCISDNIWLCKGVRF